MSIITTVIGSVVSAVVLAVGAIFCAPCSNDFKSSMEGWYMKFKSCIVDDVNTAFTSCVEVFFKPSSNNDSDELRAMEGQIMSIIPSEERDRWISDARDIMARHNRSSDHQSGGLQSCCLIGDKCQRCALLGKVKKLLKKGNGIIKLQPVKFKYNDDVTELIRDTDAGMTLNEAMSKLRDDEVQRIGIRGPKQIGKTTVVKALNNMLIETCPDLFSCIIFVPETENVDEEYVQKTIAKRLKMQADETMDTEEIAAQIKEKLQTVKFLLILDNVSKYIDLAGIGIPEDCRMSKIVLTSRSEKNCDLMKAKKISMNAMQVVKFMDDVIRECKRLPKALMSWACDNNKLV